MTTAQKILRAARNRGVVLVPCPDDTIRYSGGKDSTLEAVLRKHRAEVLGLLRSTRSLAKQVLDGEFQGCSLALWSELYNTLQKNRIDIYCENALKRMACYRTPRNQPTSQN